MNTNTTIVAGIIIVLLLVLGGFFFYAQSNPSWMSTSTPTGTGETTGTTPGQTQVAGAPAASTNATVVPTDTTAVVVGGVAPNGAMTTYSYEYGTTASLGLSTPSQPIGSGYTTLAAPAYITGLTKDTTYYFRITAQNQFGNSTGATDTFHTTVGTPAPVGSIPSVKTLAVSSVARTSANLNGQVNPNQATTQEWFEYGTTANLGAVTSVQNAGAGSSMLATSMPLTGLDPLTTYFYRLDAQNQFGTVVGSIVNFQTPGPADASVAVVTTQVPGAIATTTAVLRGTVNPSGSQTSYWFEYSTNSNFTQSSLKTTSQQSVAAPAVTLPVETNVTGLKANTTYYYRMVAQNAGGTVRGSTQSFKTK